MSVLLKSTNALLSGLLLWGLAVPALAQPSDALVRVIGVVRDEFNAISLPGVPVEVVGTDTVVYTDVDGRYALELAPGRYQIRVAMDGYEERVTELVLSEGQRTVNADVGLSMARFTETVTVTGAATLAEVATMEVALLERRRANVITDNIGSVEMKNNGDSNAASALARVTGLSVVDNSFVFVRGLGERYSNTTLNGSVVPTTQPDKKVVPLDMFPSGLLSSVTVAKSYTPDRSADFAGGLVEIVPLKFPTQPLFDVSYGIGFNSATAGKNLSGYLGSGSDWAGFDDGLRALPSAVPTGKKVIRGGIYTPDVGVLRSELQSVGQAFDNVWNLEPRSANPNQSGSVTFGQRFGKFGVLLSYTQAYELQGNLDETLKYYRISEDKLTPFSDYTFQTTEQTANIGSVANVAYQFTPGHRLTFENFLSHAGRNETRTFEGFNSDIATDIRNQRLYWTEERLVSSGLAGEHFFSQLANSRLDWRATFAEATRDEPDLREVLYERNGDQFVLADESQSGLRMFNDLADTSYDIAGNWSVLGTVNSQSIQTKFGGQYVERSRDFTSRRFRMVPLGGGARLDLTQNPELLYTAANIGAAFEIKEETRATDAYAAEQKVGSFYGMVDLALSTQTRLIGGLRVETYDQRVDTFDPFDFEGDPELISSRIEETDVFPAVNFVYSFGSNQNLRLGFSQTVNRPEFREVAPFEFTDVVGGRAIVGNPNLARALIQNYDIRYEVFPAAEEVLAVSFFYKNFDQPIERIVEPTAQLRTSFTNAAGARNAGVELEARKGLGEFVLVGGNYTYVDSKITLTPAAAQVQTSVERALAGQSPNIFNAFGEVRNDRISARVLYNFSDERISDVGSLGLPDIYQSAHGTLDMMISVRASERLNVRLSMDNLTDQAYESTQGDQLQRSYKLGRTFTFGLGFSAF
jgi:outer membrane receptor protein involved in Fe transport